MLSTGECQIRRFVTTVLSLIQYSLPLRTDAVGRGRGSCCRSVFDDACYAGLQASRIAGTRRRLQECLRVAGDNKSAVCRELGKPERVLSLAKASKDDPE